MSASIAADQPSLRRTTWPIAAIILGLACAAQAMLWYRFREDSTFSKMSVLFVWPAALFTLLLWWTFLSGYTWRTRLGVLGALTLTTVIFFAIFRIDGSDGDMVPRLAVRWEPTAEAKARQFWQQHDKPRAAETPGQDFNLDATASEHELAAGPDDSPDFRGAQRDGILRGNGFRKDWDTRPTKELWRHPVGLGWSSFAVLGDFAITQEQRDEEECVVCYSLTTGAQTWVHADKARFQQIALNGGDGPHATPVIVDQHTYALGATGLLNCLDTRSGKPYWQRNILVDAGADGKPSDNIQWGVSGSPLVHDDLVIVIAGGRQGQTFTGKSVIAYDRMTGDIRWSNGRFPASYAGPRVEDFLGTQQVLAFHADGISSLAIDSGDVLWSYEWKNGPEVNSAQPIKLDDVSLLIANGYGQGAARLELTRDENGRWSVEKKWESPRLKLKFNDAVLRNGFVYGLDDGKLTCVDVQTGKTRWKDRTGNFGYGQLLLHEDTLLILAEEGDVILVAASPDQFQELHRIPALTGTTWNHPVVANGKLLVRNSTTAACFDVAP
jgi:outer membrane protein assembly factor BamB